MKEVKPLGYLLAHQCFRHTLNDALRAWPVRVDDGDGAQVVVKVRQKSGQWITTFNAINLKEAKIWVSGFLAGRQLKGVDGDE